jgi:hypothetical protein
MTAERQVEKFDADEGTYIAWEAVNRKNHYLDATSYAVVAGHAAGVQLDPQLPPPPPRKPQPEEAENSNPLTNFRGKW